MSKEKQKFTLGFIFDSKLKRVLLIKKNRAPKGLENQMISKLNGLGGKLNIDESPYSGITREVLEESGLFIDEFKWRKFAELDAKFGYVYCFYTIVDNFIKYNDNKLELIYKQMEDEFLDIYFIENGYKYFSHMSNLDWLIPMALNHYKKLDDCEIFEVKETYNT